MVRSAIVGTLAALLLALATLRLASADEQKSATPTPTSTPTYHRDIAPILVRWGDQTNDEMCIGIDQFVPATDADRARYAPRDPSGDAAD